MRNMPQSGNEWNLSLAGCGFLGVYYFGVYSCLLERAQHLIERTTRICSASSGALIGAMIVCEMSPAKCCENLMEIYREARRGTLGAMHPSFNLLKLTRELMVRELPENAHLFASGKLCVSLTRISDGKNVLISKFTSKEDLIQAVVCSCFFPLYCGIVPPTYHRIRYVDGALSNNLPYFNLKNTITVSPFSGESDICPYGSPFYFHELRHSNVSIQVNFANTHRVIQAFFPPEPEVMAELWHNGYKDALRFLKVNDLLQPDSPMIDIMLTHKQPKCSSVSLCNKQIHNGHSESTHSGSVRAQNCTLDQHEMNLLPESIKKVFDQASIKKSGWIEELFVVKLVTSVLMVCVLPVEVIYSMIQRFAEWMPEMVSDLLWMWEMTVQVIGLVWRRPFSKRIQNSTSHDKSSH